MIAVELLGTVATVLAITGVVLNNRRSRACFLLWLASNAITLGIHWHAGIWSLVVRDAVFFVLAIEGLWLWTKRRA